jgi:hypothetical protein
VKAVSWLVAPLFQYKIAVLEVLRAANYGVNNRNEVGM